jgi:hypothetical protein
MRVRSWALIRNLKYVGTPGMPARREQEMIRACIFGGLPFSCQVRSFGAIESMMVRQRGSILASAALSECKLQQLINL